MIKTTLEKIKAHDEKIKMGNVVCKSEQCPKCGEKPEEFKLHEQKSRVLLVIRGIWVKKLITILLRWKCSICKKTFIDYPDFCLPYKRYTRDVILELSSKYLEEAQTSYEDCVSDENKVPITHEADETSNEGESELYKTFEKSTLHRWLGGLGKLKSLENIRSLIGQKSTKSALLRSCTPIFAKKYRSEARKEILQRAQNLLESDRSFKEIFGISIFPQFATRNWWS